MILRMATSPAVFRDPGLFPRIKAEIGVAAAEVLFVDGNEGNAARAASEGWNTIVFKDFAGLEPEAREAIATRI